MLPRSHSRASTENVWSDSYLQCQEVGIAPWRLCHKADLMFLNSATALWLYLFSEPSLLILKFICFLLSVLGFLLNLLLVGTFLNEWVYHIFPKSRDSPGFSIPSESWRTFSMKLTDNSVQNFQQCARYRRIRAFLSVPSHSWGSCWHGAARRPGVSQGSIGFSEV